MSVYSIAMDSILQCFIVDETNQQAKGGKTALYAPAELQELIDSSDWSFLLFLVILSINGYDMRESFEIYFEHFPLLSEELALGVACESETWFRTANVFAVVVADGELSIWAFFVAVIHDTNIATSENRAFIRIISNSELSEIKIKFLTHVQWKNKGF